jgi:hypothetical protein
MVATPASTTVRRDDLGILDRRRFVAGEEGSPPTNRAAAGEGAAAIETAG